MSDQIWANDCSPGSVVNADQPATGSLFSPKDMCLTDIDNAALLTFISIPAPSPPHTAIWLDYYASSLIGQPSKVHIAVRFVFMPPLPGSLLSSSQNFGITYLWEQLYQVSITPILYKPIELWSLGSFFRSSAFPNMLFVHLYGYHDILFWFRAPFISVERRKQFHWVKRVR